MMDFKLIACFLGKRIFGPALRHFLCYRIKLVLQFVKPKGLPGEFTKSSSLINFFEASIRFAYLVKHAASGFAPEQISFK